MDGIIYLTLDQAKAIHAKTIFVFRREFIARNCTVQNNNL